MAVDSQDLPGDEPGGWRRQKGHRVGHIGRIDDYQQRLLLKGIGIGFGVAMITAVTIGFLGIAGMETRFAGWIIFVAGMLGWIVGAAVAAKR